MRVWISIILIFASYLAISQNENKTIIDEIHFSNHWNNIGEYDNAIFVLNQIDTSQIPDKSLVDSINYLLGWNYYFLHQLDTSFHFFMLVKPSSDVYLKSRFYSAFNQSYLLNFEKSKKVLLELESESENLKKLENFELAGIALLERNMEKFDSLSKNFTYSYYTISKQEKVYFDYYETIKNFNSKSMLMAGILSGVVPGLGKVYAKRYGEGVATFFITTSLGLVTWENFHKDGLKDIKTILFGSIFTVFYVGNIWGSVFSIKMQQNDFNNAINNQILLDMHIPLRTIFN
ncbi:MAG: hypothetical protein K9J13_02205 [Saprospiraceae bacterium]|nr:hypothetical protein [Saprospiraceae bacterium]